MCRDQTHDLCSIVEKLRRNATKRWKLAAIVDFGGHFEFSYLTA